jgi:hypothetical protein
MKRFLSLCAPLAAVALLAAPLDASAQTANNNYTYLGVGATDGGLAVNGKIRLNDRFSLRPAVVIDFNRDSDVTVIAPVTYDFNSPIKGDSKLLPFAGVGLGGRSRNGGSVGAVLTGGTDFRITDKFTANAAANWMLFDNDRVDFIIGVGYNF